MGLGWALVRIEANRGHRLNWPRNDHWAASPFLGPWLGLQLEDGTVGWTPASRYPASSILELGILASSSSAAHLASFSIFPQLWSQFREALSERRFLAENQNTETSPVLARIAEETFLMKCETDAAMLNWQTAAYYQAGYKREYPYGYEYPGRTREMLRLKCLKLENTLRSNAM